MRRAALLSFLLMISCILWVRPGKAQEYRIFSEFNDEGSGITVMAMDPSRTRLICGDENGDISFRDIRDGKLIRKVKVHEAPVNSLSFNSNGRLMISSTKDGEIKIFDFNAGNIIQAVYSPDYSGIHFVLFSIADGFIYFNGDNRLYKTRSDLTQKVDKILEEEDTLYDAVITSDRSALIFSTGKLLKVLNTRNDMIRQEFQPGATKIEKLKLIGDTMLASWSNDGTINFWRFAYGQLDTHPLFWFKAGLPATMAFSDDGKTMAHGNIGSWARIWNPFDKKICQELFGHTATVTKAVFGLSNESLFTGGLDGKLILWKKNYPSTEITSLTPPSKIAASDTGQRIPKLPFPDNDVVFNAENIPQTIQGRQVSNSETIVTGLPSISVFVYDNGYMDGDTMSLFFNGKWLLDHFGVSKKRKEVILNLLPNTNNFLVLFANNLGKSPPNTAAIVFNDGKTDRFFRLSSDLGKCSALNFIYRKDP